MVLPPLSHPDAATSGCMGFAIWISTKKVDFECSIILWLSYHAYRRSGSYVYFSCNFFAPQTIFTFQGSLPEFRWHDQSEFREIIVWKVQIDTTYHRMFYYTSAKISNWRLELKLLEFPQNSQNQKISPNIWFWLQYKNRILNPIFSELSHRRKSVFIIIVLDADDMVFCGNNLLPVP